MTTSDLTFKSTLLEAQRAWLKFRDAHVKSVYPKREPGYYGSVLPMCVSLLLKDLTLERTKQLKAFRGTPEGDVCSPLGPDEEENPRNQPP